MTEHRKTGLKPVSLPKDFLKLVNELFTGHYDTALKDLSKELKNPRFSSFGQIYHEEIVLGVSILSEKSLTATTVYGSIDFDPSATQPTAQDLLNICVDAIGSVFAVLLDPKAKNPYSSILADSLTTVDNAPFDWNPIEIEKRTVFVKMDKANPEIDRATDEWLKKNDPDYRKNIDDESLDDEFGDEDSSGESFH